MSRICKKGVIGQTMSLVVATIVIFFIILIFYFAVSQLALEKAISLDDGVGVKLSTFEGEIPLELLESAFAVEVEFSVSSIFVMEDELNNVLEKLGYGDYEADVVGKKLVVRRK